MLCLDFFTAHAPTGAALNADAVWDAVLSLRDAITAATEAALNLQRSKMVEDELYIYNYSRRPGSGCLRSMACSRLLLAALACSRVPTASACIPPDGTGGWVRGLRAALTCCAHDTM